LILPILQPLEIIVPRNLLAISTIAGLVVFSAHAQASPFVNGSFEQGSAPGQFITLNGGDSTSITGWTVGGGANSVDYIGSYWTASNGLRSIDLNGLVPGSISQTFDVVAGQTYQVTFDLAGNPAGGPQFKTLDSSVAFTLFSPTPFDASNTDLANMGWISYSFLFTAVGNSATLTFASTTTDYSGNSTYPTAFGPALDNVNVAAVPEPSTWAMMILGFLGLGFLGYRKSSKTASVVRAA
jgi:choice-of-anchor C domain-containing protein